MSLSPFIPQPDDDDETKTRILLDVVLALRDLSGSSLLVTIIDAKGDLIVGTAADVAARLAAGTDGQFLVVNSATTTGLQWTSHGSSGDPHSQYVLDTDLTTTLANYILKTLLDTKGDLIVATANDTPARLGVGADTTVLMADSAQAAGLKWSDLENHFDAILTDDDFGVLVDDDGNVLRGVV